MRLAAEGDVRVDIEWVDDKTAVKVTPKKNGMVKLIKGSNEASCSANRLIPVKEVPNFFPAGKKYLGVKIHWYDVSFNPLADAAERRLYQEAKKHGLTVKRITERPQYADLLIEEIPVEITTSTPTGSSKANGPHGQNWGPTAARILGVLVHKLKTGQKGVVLISDLWLKKPHVKKYMKILSRFYGVKIIPLDFTDDNWPLKAFNNILILKHEKRPLEEIPVFNPKEYTPHTPAGAITVNGFFRWRKSSSTICFTIISKCLKNRIKEEEKRVQIKWSKDKKTVIVNPDPEGRFKLYSASVGMECAANKLISAYEAPDYFNEKSYLPVKVLWQGNPEYFFNDEKACQLFLECGKRGLPAQPVTQNQGYADIIIQGYPIEITTSEPVNNQVHNLPHGQRWGSIANRILSLLINHAETGRPNGIIIPKMWEHENHVPEYKKILSEKAGLEIFFVDFKDKNWVSEALNQITKKLLNLKN